MLASWLTTLGALCSDPWDDAVILGAGDPETEADADCDSGNESREDQLEGLWDDEPGCSWPLMADSLRVEAGAEGAAEREAMVLMRLGNHLEFAA